MTATISDVTVEPFQNDGDNVRKAVLHFHGNVIKPLVVNKTNYVILAHAFGPNTDTWIGKQIVVCPWVKGHRLAKEDRRISDILAPLNDEIPSCDNGLRSGERFLAGTFFI